MPNAHLIMPVYMTNSYQQKAIILIEAYIQCYKKEIDTIDSDID